MRGESIFAEDGVTPERIVQVDKILELDTSDLLIEGINQNDLVLNAKIAPMFSVSHSTDTCEYEAEGQFGIYETAQTKPDLERVVSEQIAFLSREFVQPDSTDELAPSGLKLREQLISAFEG